MIGVRMLLLACAAAAMAQQIYPPRVTPKEPPTFPEGETEGLVYTSGTTDGVQTARLAWKRKVFWKSVAEATGYRFREIPVHTAAERQEMTRVLDAVSNLLRATPTGSQGEGFWVNETRRLDYFDMVHTPAATPLARHSLEYEVRQFPFYHEDVLRNGNWVLSVRGETESVGFRFNWLPGVMSNPILATEPSAVGREPVEIYLKPKTTGEFQGFPIYDDSLLVIARKGRSPWASVSMGRVLKGVMPSYAKDKATAEDRLARLKRENDEVQSAAWEEGKRATFEKNNGSLRTTRPSNYSARLASLENEIKVLRQDAASKANPQHDANGAWYWNPVDAHAAASRQVAALSAEEAAKPACFVEASGEARPNGARDNAGRYAAKGDIVPAGSTPGCREIVTTNDAYFDFTMPRTAPQLLVISSFGRCAVVTDGKIVLFPARRFDAPPQGCYQHQRMWNELDWQKLAAVVRP